MTAYWRVELNNTFVAFRPVDERASHGENVSVRVPLYVLNEHSSVDQDGFVICQGLHQLNSTALVRNRQLTGQIISVFVRKALAV